MITVEVRTRTQADYIDDPKNWINIGFLSFLDIFENEQEFARLIEVVHLQEQEILRLANEHGVAWRRVDDVESLGVEKRKGPHHVYEHYFATKLDLIAGVTGGTNGITDRNGIHISPNPNITMKEASKILQAAIHDLEIYNF